MLVAMERLKIREKRRIEKGIRPMTKEEFEKWKSEEDEREKIEFDEEIVEIDPVAVRKAEFYREKGNSFFKMKYNEGALQMYEESLKHIPDSIIVYNNMATVYTKQQKYHLAVTHSNRALFLSQGTNAKSWFRYVLYTTTVR